MRHVARLATIALAVLVTVPAYAQLNGSNMLGDTGVGTGTQPAPGWYVAALYYRYSSDTIIKADGSRLTLDPNQPARVTFQAIVPMLVFVSHAKILGANYGIMFAPSFGNGSLEAPVLGLQQQVSWGAGDLYFLPITLGWHKTHADFNTAFGFFASTGRYRAGADDNIGKGMWCYEVSAGTTVFLDSKRSLSVATSAYWEAHSKKKGTDTTVVVPGGEINFTGVKVGQILTLEGGLGKSYLQGALSVGVAYYAQWKLTQDDFGIPLPLPISSLLAKHRVYAVGPDVTVPIAARKRLVSLVNIRYLWETGARVKTQGSSLIITATFPVPSPKLQ